MNQVFKETLPHIYSTIIEVANRKLIQSDWHPQIKGSLGVRCVERLEYNTGFFLDWHEDTGSIYTLILFLSQHGADYEGGEFNIWSADSEAVPYIGNLGSALIFRSECSHSVTPISKGTRTVLVLEF